MPPERVRLTFRATVEALPHDVPVNVRLRRFLKALGRYYGLDCVSVEEIRVNDANIPLQELRQADPLGEDGERQDDPAGP